MLNFKELRAQRRSWDRSDLKLPISSLLMACLAFILAIMMCGVCFAENGITTQKAIIAIMAEGEDETYMGKIALAKTILNRGHLGGVYGYTSVVVNNGQYYKKVSKKSKYFKRTGKALRLIPMVAYMDSKSAWEYALKTRGENDWTATGWGNADDVKKFKQTKWWKNCVIVAQVGNHFFYKDRRAL